MPLPVVPATCKVEFFYTLNGMPAMNRIHVGVGASLPTQSDCQTIANNMDSWWQGNVQALISDQMQINEIHVVSIAEPNGPQAFFTAGYPIVGAVASPALPSNNSFCIKLSSGLTGRSARGRWFWAGLCESQVAGNLVDSGVAASIVAAMDALLGVITSLSALPVIVSYFADKVLRPGGPVKFIITDALATDLVVDSQRGRLH